MATQGYPDVFTVGKEYTVSFQDKTVVHIVKSDDGRPDWYYEDCFDLKPTVPHIVIAKTDTGYSPNENPKVHPSFDSAAAEAHRLAKTIGGEFVVFAPVAKAVAPKVEVEFTKL
ncbi:hypothetical protein [Xanthobacter wiegelii]|uniref:hypothetical protein n=1 Tax=Xanthobacter wiegelii TaxID=3119913 RepID=UPI00372B7BD4